MNHFTVELNRNVTGRCIMNIMIRPARREDQPTIVDFIRQAHLNSRNLNWERFLVAEEDGRVVGIRQVRIIPMRREQP